MQLQLIVCQSKRTISNGNVPVYFVANSFRSDCPSVVMRFRWIVGVIISLEHDLLERGAERQTQTRAVMSFVYRQSTSKAVVVQKWQTIALPSSEISFLAGNEVIFPFCFCNNRNFEPFRSEHTYRRKVALKRVILSSAAVQPHAIDDRRLFAILKDDNWYLENIQITGRSAQVYEELNSVIVARCLRLVTMSGVR